MKGEEEEVEKKKTIHKTTAPAAQKTLPHSFNSLAKYSVRSDVRAAV